MCLAVYVYECATGASKDDDPGLCGDAKVNDINTNTQHHKPHDVSDIEPSEPANILSLDAFEKPHVAPQSFCLKEDAPWNMESILLTLDTSHFDRSPLNDVALKNITPMSLTLDTSHLDRSPLNDVA